ncbi:MAG: dihydrodipicolinate synthase family protein, partial [Acidimicrobiia bacterium]|nr:dihydrodipicolinate synthase family protein [Acidimicrobiia bacterium]
PVDPGATLPPPPRLMPALITPFTESGEIDLDAHASNVATLADRGIPGFLIAGSTGEGPYLEPGERRRLIETARAAAPHAYLMGGVGAESLRGALTQATEAAEGGADAVLAMTPTSLVRGRDALVGGFYRDVADRSPLPVFLYSVPKLTGYELPTEVVADLSSHPAVAGMKDSGGQPVRIPALLEGAAGEFDLYAGATPALSLSIAAGARGGITASSNYAYGLALAVVEAASASPGDAAAAQARLTRVATAVERHGIAGVKAAAALIGLQAGSLRRPLVGLPPADLEAVRAILAASGII